MPTHLSEDSSREDALGPDDAALGVVTDAAAGVTVLSDDPHDVAEDELASIEVVEVRPATT